MPELPDIVVYRVINVAGRRRAGYTSGVKQLSIALLMLSAYLKQ